MGLKISHLLPITMAFKFVIATALLAGFQFMASHCAPSSTDIEDFEEDHYGYTYIYHDAKDLLLTVHNHSCYFIKADDNHDHSDRFLSDDKPLGYFPSPRHAAEAFIRKIVRENNTHKVHPSSLTEVTEIFDDLAARRECWRKDIFRVDFNWDELAMNE